MNKNDFLKGLNESLTERDKKKPEEVATYFKPHIGLALESIQAQIKEGADVNNLLVKIDVTSFDRTNLDLGFKYVRIALNELGIELLGEISIREEDRNAIDKGTSGYISDVRTMLYFRVKIKAATLNEAKGQ